MCKMWRIKSLTTNYLIWELAHHRQLMNRCFYHSPRPKRPPLSMRALRVMSTDGVLLENGAAKILAGKIFVFQFIESVRPFAFI